MWDPSLQAFYFFNRRTNQFTWDEPEGFRESYSDQLLARDPEISLAMQLQRNWRASRVRKTWSALIAKMKSERLRREAQAKAEAAAAAAAAKKKKRRMRPSEMALASQQSNSKRGDNDSDDEYDEPVGSQKVLEGIPDPEKLDLKKLGSLMLTGTVKAAVSD